MHNNVFKVSDDFFEEYDDLSWDIDETWFVREICDWYTVKENEAEHELEYTTLKHASYQIEHDSHGTYIVFPKEPLEMAKRGAAAQLAELVKRLKQKTIGPNYLESFSRSDPELDGYISRIKDIWFGEMFGDYIIYDDEIVPVDVFIRNAVPDKKYYLHKDVIDYHW